MAPSHKPNRELMTGARLWLTIYCAESSAPSVELVDAESTNWMEAFLATAPDHSTSNSASVCSLEETMPGFCPFRTIVGVLAGSPKVERKFDTSAIGKLVRPRSEEHTSELQSLRH